MSRLTHRWSYCRPVCHIFMLSIRNSIQKQTRTFLAVDAGGFLDTERRFPVHRGVNMWPAVPCGAKHTGSARYTHHTRYIDTIHKVSRIHTKTHDVHMGVTYTHVIQYTYRTQSVTHTQTHNIRNMQQLLCVYVCEVVNLAKILTEALGHGGGWVQVG